MSEVSQVYDDWKKALETDTIAAVDNPINMEFLETQRRLAISGTGISHLMMINAIDKADSDILHQVRRGEKTNVKIS